jgi:hypothetical protein
MQQRPIYRSFGGDLDVGNLRAVCAAVLGGLSLPVSPFWKAINKGAVSLRLRLCCWFNTICPKPEEMGGVAWIRCGA